MYIKATKSVWMKITVGILTVLHHTWHTSEAQLILSAASDGSLHAWNYNTQLGSPVIFSDSADEQKEVTGRKDKDNEGATSKELRVE